MLGNLNILLVPIFGFLLCFSSAIAQDTGKLRDRHNAGTVRIIAGTLDSTSTRVSAELSAVLDAPDKLRVLTMLGKGSMQNITDILYLKGIDIGIVQSDVLSYARQVGSHNSLNKQIHYITKLYNEEFHLLVNKKIQSIEELAGKRVNFGPSNSGTNISAVTVFGTLGVDVKVTNFEHDVALEKVKTGDIDAMVFVDGKPIRLFQDLSAKDGVHFLPVSYTPDLLETYTPSSVSGKDYPGLIPPDHHVATLAVSAVMAAYNWPTDSKRYEKVSRFAETLLSRFLELRRTPRHAKWFEVNPSAEVPGWTRFKAAEDWLGAASKSVARIDPSDPIHQEVDKFLETDFALAGLQMGRDQAEFLLKNFLAARKEPKYKSVALYRVADTGLQEKLGTVRFQDSRYGLEIRTEFQNLEPGPHGFHIHQFPDCSPKEKDGKLVGALAAGGHLDPNGDGHHHGPLFDLGHLGDMPVLIVDKTGKAKKTLLAPQLHVSDIVDHAVIIHGAGNDPTRVACGVIK